LDCLYPPPLVHLGVLQGEGIGPEGLLHDGVEGPLLLHLQILLGEGVEFSYVLPFSGFQLPGPLIEDLSLLHVRKIGGKG